MVIPYDTSGIENALICHMLCAWLLSQSQACEAIYCVRIVEPRDLWAARRAACNRDEECIVRST